MAWSRFLTLAILVAVLCITAAGCGSSSTSLATADAARLHQDVASIRSAANRRDPAAAHAAVHTLEADISHLRAAGQAGARGCISATGRCRPVGPSGDGWTFAPRPRPHPPYERAGESRRISGSAPPPEAGPGKHGPGKGDGKGKGHGPRREGWRWRRLSLRQGPPSARAADIASSECSGPAGWRRSGSRWTPGSTARSRSRSCRTCSPSTTDYVRRFEREAHVVANLSHPHLVRVYDFSVDGPRPYLVMEYVAGGSLADRLRRTRRPDPGYARPGARAARRRSATSTRLESSTGTSSPRTC